MKGDFFANPESWRIMGEAYEEGWHIELNTHNQDLGFSLRFLFPFPVDPEVGIEITDARRIIAESMYLHTPPAEDLDYMTGLETTKSRGGNEVRCVMVDVMAPPNQRLLDGLRKVSQQIIDSWQAE